MYGDDPEDHYYQAGADGCLIVGLFIAAWVVIGPFVAYYYFGG